MHLIIGARAGGLACNARNRPPVEKIGRIGHMKKYFAIGRPGMTGRLMALFLPAVIAVIGLAVSAEGGEMRKNDLQEIYLAGGCFWGVQEYFSRIPGVERTVAGYANSRVDKPSYEHVCDGGTNAAEAVRVVYDPAVVSLETIIRQYFKIIDPMSLNRQGNDVGTQYRTGIYYTDESLLPVLRRLYDAEQAARREKLAVELGPLRNFWPAESYHQDYLKKNPGGYCHIDFSSLKDLPAPGAARARPDDAEIRRKLSPEEYAVTQQGATEAPFSGRYWNTHEAGIYVDVVTGEPLFLSSDKFDSGTGWPSFVRPVEKGAVKEYADKSHGMSRVEVRSSRGGSHLGHVFPDGPAERGGMRYCINSAALRFVPLGKMESEGYGQFIPALKDGGSQDKF